MSVITTQPVYLRGQIWWVDFGQPIGQEFGMEHPAVIVSCPALNGTVSSHGRIIVVPGTSTRIEAPGTARPIVTHQEVQTSQINGLRNTTYFKTEDVLSLSVLRLNRLIGTLEPRLLHELENRLCLVMGLFRPGI